MRAVVGRVVGVGLEVAFELWACGEGGGCCCCWRHGARAGAGVGVKCVARAAGPAAVVAVCACVEGGRGGALEGVDVAAFDVSV